MKIESPRIRAVAEAFFDDKVQCPVEELEGCRDLEEYSALTDGNDDYDIFHPRSVVDELVRRYGEQIFKDAHDIVNNKDNGCDN